jgi:flagellar biosynthesis anti-sigma factor FlgM
MALKLNGIGLDSTAVSSTYRPLSTTGTSAESAEATQQAGSEVSITSTASMLARLQQTLAAQSPIDQKRVDAISKALAAGTYAVHADKIAEHLIHTELTLGQLTEI